MASPAPAPARPAGHRRNKSASVLLSIMSPRSHKRAPSDGTALHPSRPLHDLDIAAAARTAPTAPDPKAASPLKSLRQRTKSSVSLRSLGRPKEDTLTAPRGEGEETSPKKTKSSANLAGLFKSRPKTGRHDGGREAKDGRHDGGREAKAGRHDEARQAREAKDGKSARGKENTAPPNPAAAPRDAPRSPVHTPIWAEFSTRPPPPLQEITATSRVPLNDRRSIEEEIALYTPSHYSPSKQRNFADVGQPALQKRPPPREPREPKEPKERPKSTFLPTTGSATLLQTFTRKRSNDRIPLGDTKGNGRPKDGPSDRSTASRGMLSRSSSDGGKKQENVEQKKPNRVMAAVAAFNGRSRDAQAPTSPTKLDPKDVEAQFETVLESRNIPQQQRKAMRTLKLEVKADFVRTHKLDTPSMSRAASGQSSIADTVGKKSAKSTLGKASKSRDGADEEAKVLDVTTNSGTLPKRERPRSKTFTFSKGDSPSKKQKPEKPVDERKISSKSAPIQKSPSMRSLVSNASSKSAKAATPDEFVTYMKSAEKVQDVEVGRLHKLRQLLRNETVEWVDTFVQEDGMTELVALLHRIMEVEWREDHEDQLLHEVLRCLKGLCTTDSALKQLAQLAPTLFPALLAMLFDEEHKGPSEFTTRELIIQIMFAHLSTAPEAEMHSRAAELLKYLKDPIKEKESSTVPFILQMHHPRPYQVWCKEITNVTKEVFWIFIHHLNVVPLPKRTDGAAQTQTYAKTHFPGPRAIVPAAPYVGGVEWDATNYVATHIDLLNGLLASLPTREERNTVRSELKVSGFEKLMGHLRACNPKYYGAVHDSVKVWVAAAVEDGWDVKTARMGSSDGKPPSPCKSSPKKKVEDAPRIEAPKMVLGLGLGLDMQFEREIGGPVKKYDDDDWF